MPSKLVSLSTCFCLAAISTSSFAASFDCKKASTLVEKTICSEPPLSKLDEQMAVVYKQVLIKSDDRAGIKTYQKEWLSTVRDRCPTKQCLRTAYQAHLTELNLKNTSTGQTNTAWLGDYQRYYKNKPDENTATITIKPSTSHQVKVAGNSIWIGDAASGNVNLGELEGDFPVVKNSIQYKSDGCELTIVFNKTGLEVKNDNLQCGGLNVNFDGVYRKVK